MPMNRITAKSGDYIEFTQELDGNTIVVFFHENGIGIKTASAKTTLKVEGEGKYFLHVSAAKNPQTQESAEK